jgi:cytochrome P460
MRAVNSMSVGRLILINSVSALFVMIALGFSLAQTQQPGQAGPGPLYDDGNLLRPSGFETWVFVGSNLGLGYADWARSMTTAEARRTQQQNYHNVYINPASYAAYVASSIFPEGTMLVMDIYEAANKETRVPDGKQSILNAGTFNGRRRGFEVAVKDSRRPNRRDVVGEDRSVGEWAYYSFGPMSMKAPAEADRDCYDCHRDHAADDKVWVQFYPVLRRIRNPE